jgi:hypothetical protein
VVDQYTLSADGAVLRRANLLAQDRRQIIEEAIIRGGRVQPLRVVSVETLDGKKAELLPTTDLPEVPAQTEPGTAFAVQLVLELRRQTIGQLCKRVN